MGFVVAKALLHGTVDLDHYRAAALADPETHRLAALVRTEEDGSADPNALAPQAVRVRLRDGRSFDWACDVMLANPARPFTRAQHLAKFRRCWEFAADPLPETAREALIERVEDLEAMSDVGGLARLAGGAD